MTRKSAACAGLRTKNAPTAPNKKRLKRFIALSLHSVFAICDAALRRQNRMRRGELLARRHSRSLQINIGSHPGVTPLATNTPTAPGVLRLCRASIPARLRNYDQQDK